MLKQRLGPAAFAALMATGAFAQNNNGVTDTPVENAAGAAATAAGNAADAAGDAASDAAGAAADAVTGTDAATAPAVDAAITDTPATDAATGDAATEAEDAAAKAASQVAAITGTPATATTEATATATATPSSAPTAPDTAAPAAVAVAPIMASDVSVREGYAPAPADRITVESLRGAPVYAAGDEKIGDISDLVASSSGQIEQVIVGVGGFLGIGERDVAYPFDQVSFQQRADGTDLRAYVGTAAAEVQNLQAYTRN